MSFVSQRSARATSYSRSRSRGPPSRSRSASAMGGGGPASMSQGGVPGGGVVKLMRQVPSVEAKFFDSLVNTSSSGSFTNIGGTTLLAGITQGVGNSQRVGRKIRVLGFIFRTSMGHLPGPYTFDLVRDKACNGIVATVDEIYAQGGVFPAMPNPLYEKRFQFLKRVENYNASQQLSTAATNSNFIISFSKKCNFTCEFDASTGAITDLSSDNIMLWAAGSASLTGSGYFRVLYTDA